MKELEDLKELQQHIAILEDFNGKRRYTNYDSLTRDLLVYFGLRVTRRDLQILEEPTLEEETLDIELMYKNVC